VRTIRGKLIGANSDKTSAFAAEAVLKDLNFSLRFNFSRKKLTKTGFYLDFYSKTFFVLKVKFFLSSQKAFN